MLRNLPVDDLELLRQEEREAALLRLLGQQMGAAFHPKSLPLPGGGALELDGFSAQPRVACQVFADQSQQLLTAAEEERAVLDIWKLAYASETLGHTLRRVLLFADRAAARRYLASGAIRDAIEDAGVEVHIAAETSQIH
jgi:hypothetical protein